MKAQQEYESLTERIEAQKEKKLNRFIAALAAVIQESDEEPAKDTSSEEDDEDIVLISLFSLRIKTECELIREGSRDLVEQVKEDIEELVSHVQSFEYESTISEMVRSDAYDLLKSICLEEDREMIQQNYNWNLPWKAAVGIPQEMFFLFMSTAAYMQNIGKNGEAVKVLEALCTYSRKRGNKNHKEVIFRAISQMGGDSPEAICRIGDAEQQLFAGDTSLYAGDFYWFYGDSLQNLGRAEDAMHVFEQCFQIRKNCLGEENYYTELARRGRAICEFSCTNGREGRADLLHFVDRIESGDFEDQENPEQLQIFELKTLCIALMGMSDHSSNQNAYRRYLELYIQLCRKYKDTGETCASMRMAWNFLGAFYMNVGEYMQAEEAFQQALKAEASDEEISMLSTIDIQSNLLLIYYVQNDQEKAYPLLDEMYRLTEEEEEQQTIREETLDRMDTLAVALRMQMMDQADSEELADLSDLLVETCTDLLSADAGTITREKAVFAIICMFYFMQQESGTRKREEQKYFCRTLQRIEQESQILDLTAMQTAMMEYGKALLLWNLGQEEADASFQSLIDKMENRGIQPIQKAAIYQSYGTVLCRSGRNTEGFSYLEKSLDEITNVWHPYVKYLNDTRLIMILAPVQMTFHSCYARGRQFADSAVLYEWILRFKALASLAGRERNRMLQKNTVQPELLERIRKAQNAVAALESENMLRNAEKDYEKQLEDLRNMENEFAACFPENIDFMKISLETVQNAIPDDTAVVEYFLTVDQYGQMQSEDRNEVPSVFDVYITTKKSGCCSLRRITISGGMEIATDARNFVWIMQRISQGEASIEETEELETLRYRLYHAVISPVLSEIEEYETVYLAPDDELINVPFDLLYDEKKIRIADRHNCIKIECARDFLFETMESSGSKATLIVGSPEYEVRERRTELEREKTEETGRDRKMDLDTVEKLPFSKVEAYRICSRTGGRMYTGAAATKNVVLSAHGYKNIHIATHGYFDMENQDISLYSSWLAFTGIKNWYRTGVENPVYGNGLLTADEVSRMDLTSTKLVVLSSCLSGMNEVFLSTGFHGMVSAFSAAGVKYVISSLWSVNDLATAVFMDAFYSYYANGAEEPPTALRKAQDYLWDATIEELRMQGWFRSDTYQLLDEESQEFMESLEEKNGRWKPFRKEAFWGGFVCCQCH